MLVNAQRKKQKAENARPRRPSGLFAFHFPLFTSRPRPRTGLSAFRFPLSAPNPNHQRRAGLSAFHFSLFPRRNTKGFTIFEGVTAMTIMVFVLLVVNQIFLVNADFTAKALTRVDNDNGATLAVRRIGELSRGATAVLSSQTINGTLYTTGTNVLVLQVPSLDSSGNIITGLSDYVAFYRHATSTTQIYTDLAPGTGSARKSGQKLLTDNNTLLAFSYNNPNPYNATRVSVFLVNEKTVRRATITTKEWTSIFLRNH